jgi:hypothetical protein
MIKYNNNKKSSFPAIIIKKIIEITTINLNHKIIIIIINNLNQKFQKIILMGWFNLKKKNHFFFKPQPINQSIKKSFELDPTRARETKRQRDKETKRMLT